MKKALIVLLGIIISISSYATSIVVGDTIAVDSVWSGVDTVKLDRDLLIEDGACLTIAPGIVIEAQGMYRISVQGRILAIGTDSDTIIFTAFDTTEGWNRLVFDYTPSDNDTSVFQYCIFEYGKPVHNSDAN